MVWRQETLIICIVIKYPYPKINLSLVIQSDFAVHVFCRDVEMNTVGNYKIPKHVTDQNSLEILIENIRKMNIEQQQMSKSDFYIKIDNVISTIGVKRIKQTF